MPVTAKVSQESYERLGDEGVDELVDRFNSVDATYQMRLREINELNWERFKAELRSGIAESESRQRNDIACVRAGRRSTGCEVRQLHRSQGNRRYWAEVDTESGRERAEIPRAVTVSGYSV